MADLRDYVLHAAGVAGQSIDAYKARERQEAELNRPIHPSLAGYFQPQQRAQPQGLGGMAYTPESSAAFDQQLDSALTPPPEVESIAKRLKAGELTMEQALQMAQPLVQRSGANRIQQTQPAMSPRPAAPQAAQPAPLTNRDLPALELAYRYKTAQAAEDRANRPQRDYMGEVAMRLAAQKEEGAANRGEKAADREERARQFDEQMAFKNKELAAKMKLGAQKLEHAQSLARSGQDKLAMDAIKSYRAMRKSIADDLQEAQGRASRFESSEASLFDQPGFKEERARIQKEIERLRQIDVGFADQDREIDELEHQLRMKGAQRQGVPTPQPRPVPAPRAAPQGGSQNATPWGAPKVDPYAQFGVSSDLSGVGMPQAQAAAPAEKVIGGKRYVKQGGGWVLAR